MFGVAQRYIKAWNHHDASALVGMFAPGGTYCDPATDGLINGSTIGQYAEGLWAAFPDLRFEVVNILATSDGATERGLPNSGVVALQWRMYGTQLGSMLSLPPSGRTLALPGADFITVEEDMIRSLVGYFDQRLFLAQIGLQVVVQPERVGPFVFGTCNHVQSGSRARPGAFSITHIDVRSPQELNRVVADSRKLVNDMMAMCGFISWLGVIVGNRLMTITAWEHTDDPHQVASNPTHRASVKLFYGPQFARSASIGTWQPEQISTWIRCTSCGRMVGYERAQGMCHCGERLPHPPPCW